MPTSRAQGLLSVPAQASAGLPYQVQNAVDLGLLSIAPQQRQYVQALEPFVGSYNPLNPAFRDTIRAGINNMIGGRAIGGTPTQRYRAKMADLATGLLDVAPGIGDAMGISDTRQAARSGDYGTALLLGGATALGMVPGIGDAASKAVKSGLDMSLAARLKRAAEHGFDTSTVMHHGSKEKFNAFDYNKIGANARAQGPGFYFSSDPNVAKGYGDVGEYFIKLENPISQTQKPFSVNDTAKMLKELALDQARKEGIDVRDTFLANFANTYDTGIDSAIRQAAQMLTEYNDTAVDQISELFNLNLDKRAVLDAVTKITGHDGILGATPDVKIPFHAKNIRSVNAAFDPARKESGNILAGAGGAAILGGSALSSNQSKERKPD